MTYASLTRRAQLIAGLREFATFVEANPHVPAPSHADLYVFPPDGEDAVMRAEIDRIAALLGITPDNPPERDRYTAVRAFGPVVTLRVVAIFTRTRANHRALQSYVGAVTSDQSSDTPEGR